MELTTLTCEKCGENNDTVIRAFIGYPNDATVGNLCNVCKVRYNLEIIQPFKDQHNKFVFLNYAKARAWVITNE